MGTAFNLMGAFETAGWASKKFQMKGIFIRSRPLIGEIGLGNFLTIIRGQNFIYHYFEMGPGI